MLGFSIYESLEIILSTSVFPSLSSVTVEALVSISLFPLVEAQFLV